MRRERFARRMRLVRVDQQADVGGGGRGFGGGGAGAAKSESESESRRRRSPVAIWRRTPLRARLALAATIAVAAGVGGGVGFAYVAVRHSLIQEMDDALTKQGVRFQSQLNPQNPPVHLGGKTMQFDATPQFGETRIGYQFIDAIGRVVVPMRPTTHGGVVKLTSYTAQQQSLPITTQDKQVADGSTDRYIRSTQWNGQHVRILTLPIGNGYAVQIDNPLTTMDKQLSTLGWELFGAGAAGIVLAAGLGWLVTRTTLRPVAELTSTAERIAATHDLAHRIAIDGRPGEPRDELGRLAATFNGMLDAVQEATDRQRQLVADASHELRTPLTSLRTNVEVLAHAHRLDPEDREALVTGIMSGLDDLTTLVSDTVELARGEEQAALFEELRFDLLVQRCVDRATTHWPKVTFKETLQESVVVGVTDRLAKAVRNLLDNAAKFSPEGGLIEVGTAVSGGGSGGGDGGMVTLTVRDHGPGIPEEDMPHVFDRFYRAASARDLPGSGLGLAIVAQVAVGHGGGVTAEGAEGGGAEFRLTLPVAKADAGS